MSFSNQYMGLCAHLLTTLKLTHNANEHIAHVTLCMSVGFGVQAQSVQDAGQQADVVTDLCSITKLHKCRQIPQT